ncbi:glycine zipper 2TM domain-containing protein [Novosphingobium beihaiensis]|uniref:17 kDa surface antigen n=1 Tax=Novosphingobium beihaiensis TaxID=2930389 RepID=A0ABT0BR52_9SPHN|nr:glycine zipper 2TM domain-containing protein [Novosphingobium beihaiensis]MCJ2187527.1 glycine zipper 2TM domain-containing protein [Novosphingobium beihaiensis]
MRLYFPAAVAALTLLASPALAQDGPPLPDPRTAPPAYPGGPRYGGFDPAARDAWLADCRGRVAQRDSGVGGAAIGGLVGAAAGNRIAGKHHRTVGTLAGAAVGAVAGAAIDKAEDAGRNRDECEAYLDDYYARYTHGGMYPGYGGGYGYQGYGYPQGYYPAQGCCMAQPVMMVPVMMVPAAQPHCTETVEYVYEDVPARPRPARRVIPKRTKIVPDKRVKTTKLQPVK